MFQTPTILATSVLVIGSLLGTQANAGHAHEPISLLAAACKLKDTICAFEAINCQRPMTAYTLHQVKALRISAEQFHEAVRCQSSPLQIAIAFDRVCAYAARADFRFQRSRNFRLDPEWSTAWSCVQADMATVRCLVKGPCAIAAPTCGVQVGYGVPHTRAPYTAPQGLQLPPHRQQNYRQQNYRQPSYRQPSRGFDSRPQVLPPAHLSPSNPAQPFPNRRFDSRPQVLPPPANVPPSNPAQPFPNRREARYGAVQNLLLSLLR